MCSLHARKVDHVKAFALPTTSTACRLCMSPPTTVISRRFIQKLPRGRSLRKVAPRRSLRSAETCRTNERPASLAGFHAGLLLPAILDRSEAGLPQETGRRDAVGWVGVHQEHLGAGHVLRQREAVLLSHRDHVERVHPHTSLRVDNEEYPVSTKHLQSFLRLRHKKKFFLHKTRGEQHKIIDNKRSHIRTVFAPENLTVHVTTYF